MLKHLAKTPLLAVCFAALLYFSGVFLPYSEGFRAAEAAFATPLFGHLFLIGYSLLVSVMLVLSLSLMSGGALSTVCLFLTTIAYQWIIPSLRLLWYGDAQNILTNQDVLLSILRGSICTLLLLALALPARKPPATAGATYQLKILPLLLTIVALPFLYLILYLASWYYLGWQNAAIRAYLGGPAEAETLVKAILENLLLKDPVILPFVLLSGLAMVLLALPLMTRLAAQRPVFILSILLLTASVGLRSLIPVPWIPEEVRVPLFLRDTILTSVYGMISALLLHLAYRKQEVTPTPAARPAGVARPADPTKMPPGITAKQAAGAVQATMRES